MVRCVFLVLAIALVARVGASFPPQDFELSVDSAYQITANWNQPTPGGGLIDSYVLDRSEDPGFSSVTPLTNADVMSFVDTTVVPGTMYYYRVAADYALTGIGNYAYSDATPSGPPLAPPAFSSLVLSATGVALSWSAADAQGDTITAYLLERDTSDTFSAPVVVFDGLDFAANDTGLTPGTQYHYRVSACNGNGCGATSQTSAVPTGPPQAVDFLSTSVISSSVLFLVWGSAVHDNGAAVTSYHVERALDAAFTMDLVVVVDAPASAHSQSDSGLVPGVTYFYSVTACNANGCGPAIIASETPSGPPNAPTAFSSRILSATALSLSWSAADGNGAAVGNYTLRRADNAAMSENLAVVGRANALSLNDTGLMPGSVHYYTVVATNENGDGPAAQIGPVALPTPVPTTADPTATGTPGTTAMPDTTIAPTAAAGQTTTVQPTAAPGATTANPAITVGPSATPSPGMPTTTTDPMATAGPTVPATTAAPATSTTAGPSSPGPTTTTTILPEAPTTAWPWLAANTSTEETVPCGFHGDCVGFLVPFCRGDGTCLPSALVDPCLPSVVGDCGMDLYCRPLEGTNDTVCQSFCPPIEAGKGLASSQILLLIALGSLVGIGLIVSVASFFTFCCTEADTEVASGADHWVPLSISIAVADVVTDFFFALSLRGRIATLSWIFILTPVVINLVFVMGFWCYQGRIATKEMKKYNASYNVPAAFIFVLSLLNLDSLALLVSNLFGLGVFRAPLNESGRRALKLGRLTNVLFEDIPQVGLVILVTRDCFGWDVVTIASVGFSCLSILVTLLSRILIAQNICLVDDGDDRNAPVLTYGLSVGTPPSSYTVPSSDPYGVALLVPTTASTESTTMASTDAEAARRNRRAASSSTTSTSSTTSSTPSFSY